MSSDSSSSYEDEKWIDWYCSQSGNQFFCHVDRSYIEDHFNSFGLRQYFPGGDFGKAMDTILDKGCEPETEELHRSTQLLYGLMHARFIITQRGLEAMGRKYKMKDFGECSRMLCGGQEVLPMGCADDPKHGTVKLFCPRCRDVYNCQREFRHIDGAYFGPTFPNMFFMAFENQVPDAPPNRYIPRIFGFRIHESSASLPKNGSNPQIAVMQQKRNDGAENEVCEGATVSTSNNHSLGVEQRLVMKSHDESAFNGVGCKRKPVQAAEREENKTMRNDE